jgi:hypothetical protein
MEKRINEIKIRLTDSEMVAVSQLANIDDRTLGDYLHHVIALHLFGHEYKLQPAEVKCQQMNRD